jgi:hypothetical protein
MSLDSSYIVDQYEALRKEAIGAATTRGHGLALFLFRGMTAWLSALSAVAPPALPREAQVAHFRADLPPGVRCDLTAVMADMVLSCYSQESPR